MAETYGINNLHQTYSLTLGCKRSCWWSILVKKVFIVMVLGVETSITDTSWFSNH